MPKVTVEAGDTLSQIAKRNGITLSKLLKLNPDFRANSNLIHAGAEVKLPYSNDINPDGGSGNKDNKGGGSGNKGNKGNKGKTDKEKQEANREHDPLVDNPNRDAAQGGLEIAPGTGGMTQEDQREEITFDSEKITFDQVARSLGISTEELIEQNPAIGAAYGPTGPPGNVWGMDIQAPDGKPFFGLAGNVRGPKNRAGLENARVSWDDRLEQGRTQETAIVDDLLNQDPQWLAFVRGMDLKTADAIDLMKYNQDKLQDSFQATKELHDYNMERGTNTINQSAAGRGMYFGSGRGRDTDEFQKDMIDRREEARLRMVDQQGDHGRIRTQTDLGITRDTADERMTATERIQAQRLEDEYPEVY